MNPRTENLVKECRRQYINCLYAAASLYIWQKYARGWRAAFLVLPIVLGAFASSQILSQFADGPAKLAGAVCSMVAGFFPAIFKALNLDMQLESISRSAAEFTNLRDRFRRAANVTALGPFDKFEAEYDALLERMDSARAAAPPSPEWCFRKAQAQVARGDYGPEAGPPNDPGLGR